jgi:hypothetical protein
MIKNQSSGLYDEYLLDNETNIDYGGYYVGNEADSVKYQSPTAALFKSMLIPGWGQVGNHAYIKAAVVIGLESVLIGAVVHHIGKTSDAKKPYDAALLTSDADLITTTFGVYDTAKNKRNQYYWMTGAFIFISMFDAYVDAHLARFPKRQKELSLKVMPGQQEDIKAVLALKF